MSYDKIILKIIVINYTYLFYIFNEKAKKNINTYMYGINTLRHNQI